jgi:hypothetical protein
VVTFILGEMWIMPFFIKFSFGIVFPLAAVAQVCFHFMKNEKISRLLDHRQLNLLMFSVVAVWCLWKISRMGEADFGQYREFFLLFFCLLIIAMMRYNYGLLAVRGIAIGELLWAKEILDHTMGTYTHFILVLNLVTYMIIIFSLYFSVCPYQLGIWLLDSRSK